MRILWVKPDFLHPTTRGGQIRTLEMLRCLHRSHEVHYVGLYDGTYPEALERASEYCSRYYAIPHQPPSKDSPLFAVQLARSLFSPMPVAVSRWISAKARRKIEELLAREGFDTLVCDFLASAPNIPDISRAVLFQHNVESMIWARRAEHARNPVEKRYLQLQHKRMRAVEADWCHRAGRVVAVSAADAGIMQREFGVAHVSEVATGVDVDYFAPPPESAPGADLVFVGSMDWYPNEDGVGFFLREVWPRIVDRRPETTVAIVGRKPPTGIAAQAQADARITVTGTVPDVRPYFWGARASIVPLRIGGGTRLKIYEAMAAGVPVISTSIGYEGLPLTPGRDLEVADTAEEFAARCMRLLEDPAAARCMGHAGRELVKQKYSWETVVRGFEAILAAGPRPSGNLPAGLLR